MIFHLINKRATTLSIYLSVKLELTFFLKKSLSSRVRVSALAMTGTIFTTLLRRLINSTSKGLRLRK